MCPEEPTIDDPVLIHVISGVSTIWGREVLSQSRAKRACKIFSHAPKTLTMLPNNHTLDGSWLIKKALVAMRNCYLGSEFQRPVSLLLVVAASYWLSVTVFVTELRILLLCQSWGGCSSSLSSTLDMPLAIVLWLYTVYVHTCQLTVLWSCMEVDAQETLRMFTTTIINKHPMIVHVPAWSLVCDGLTRCLTATARG